ncbi:AI-2E family transporter [Spirochaeta cellobiosiphila]|uniref:AI-2E family transporter n=1 Tax=Spirochaeta cellobiosiphila TaxID=504483 RepID=UPI000426D094|nr:AI-2E family transporter [Spirochaeta cellobiosiphila]
MKNRIILTTLLLAVSILFLYMTRFFLLPLMLSLTIVVLINPFYHKLEKKLNNKSNLAAVITTLLILLIILIPVGFFLQVLIKQSFEVYSKIQTYLKDPGIGQFIQTVNDWPLLDRINLNEIDWQSLISQGISQITKFTTKAVNTTSNGVFQSIAYLFIVLFSLFFFLKDQERMMEGLKKLLPLEPTVIDHLAQKFKGTSKSAVQATLFIGVLQGVIGSITFIIVGIDTWMLWGAVMTILSIVPLVGSYIIMVPAALIFLAGGHIWQFIFILFTATVASYGVDNLLRPVFLSKDTRMHELLVFISSLGGMGLFGLTGFIAGPVIAATLLSLLQIYKEGPISHKKDRLHTRIRRLRQ